MEMKERNSYVGVRWRNDLTEAERQEFNRRARTEEVTAPSTEIKRILKRIDNECYTLETFGVQSMFLADSLHNGMIDVFGDERSREYVRQKNIGAQYYAFINGEGQASGKQGCKVPYKEISSGQSDFSIQNLPAGVQLKHPSSYGIAKMKVILAAKNEITFAHDPLIPTTPNDPLMPTTPNDPLIPTTPNDPLIPTTPNDPLIPTTPQRPTDANNAQRPTDTNNAPTTH
ncbi:General transcription factor II-I [Desmophyllum pertusum]|uniref:General transcription factor II-I n=1 Tax=Desmophyllum pertusum TaxID=174260 RepID=A0A9W9YIL7_9CNID|nr:General transcription factor II-I [Desmophyllum pertusum]